MDAKYGVFLLNEINLKNKKNIFKVNKFGAMFQSFIFGKTMSPGRIVWARGETYLIKLKI